MLLVFYRTAGSGIEFVSFTEHATSSGRSVARRNERGARGIARRFQGIIW